MKKILFFLIATLPLFSLKAQTASGNMMAGGTLSFSSTTEQGDGDIERKSFVFVPSFGYFISDNFAVGANLYVISETDDFGASKQVETQFGLGPFARYYKFSSNENFAFFGQAQFAFLSGKVDNTPGGEAKNSTIQFSVAPGFAYFFNEHWAAELAITGFVLESHDPNKDVDDDNENTVLFELSSFSPTIGIRYHFGN